MFQHKGHRIFLMLVLSILAVVGCSSNAAETEEAVSQETTETEGSPVDEGAVQETEEVETAETEQTEEEMEPVTITYIASQNWILDTELELAERFEAETGIHVDFQIIPSDQYFNVLQTKLESGGEGLDIFGGQSGKTDIALQLNVEENAVPLTDEEWVTRMNPLSTEQVSLEGTVYGLTIWDTIGGSWVVVYNKQIFADNGIEVPTMYGDFAAACETLLDAGITPIFEPVADGWHHVLWFAELGPIYAANSPGLVEALNANEVKLADDSTMLLALEQLKELYTNGCFGIDALSNEFANTESSLANGEYAMTVNRLGLPAQIESAYPDVSADTFGFFVMPLADNQIWNVNPAAPSKFIYSGSEHIDAAKAYFEFLTRPENLQYTLDNEEQFVLLNFDGLKAELTADQQAFVDTYTEQGTVLQTAVNYVNPQWMDIGQDLVANFTDALTPMQVLQTIDQRRADMAQAADDPAWR
jgi:raffinose/stachyose/melibiose transport system substrate-binding protein